MNWKAWGARAAVVLLLAGAAQPFYLRFLTGARTPFGRWAAALPYQKTPGLRAFLAGVRARTRPGDTIAIAVPMRRWDGGYAYAFTRATYLLAGRTTVPLVGSDDRPLPANLAAAQYVAVWGAAPVPPGFEPAWRDANGILLRRSR